MAIKSLADINEAFDDGRWHMQRVLKNQGTAHSQWMDNTFASGQPGYDARVGTVLQFTPCVAAKNDAVYFPDTPAGMTRHLVATEFWALHNTYSGPRSVYLFDLLGYYPLVDGDSTDRQDCDNQVALPRYADGDGVYAVFVNHVAPATQNGAVTVGYVDDSGTDNSFSMNVQNVGVNYVVSGTSTAANGYGGVVCPLGNGSKGIRSISYVRYSTPPGGLHCIYLIKPLGTMLTGDQGVATEKSFIKHNGFNAPVVKDGAWLGWFDRSPSSGTALTWFGNFTFVWG